mmetsp:Transcript_3046/g.6161  ORF Transcript_3046/g.6161 Transcript_3046/m.6161 type:complete len:372 (-) Transcript_3046:41-1156(-)
MIKSSSSHPFIGIWIISAITAISIALSKSTTWETIWATTWTDNLPLLYTLPTLPSYFTNSSYFNSKLSFLLPTLLLTLLLTLLILPILKSTFERIVYRILSFTLARLTRSGGVLKLLASKMGFGDHIANSNVTLDEALVNVGERVVEEGVVEGAFATIAATSLYLNPLPYPYNFTTPERHRIINSLPPPFRSALMSRVKDGLREARGILLPRGVWADALLGGSERYDDAMMNDNGDFIPRDLVMALPGSTLQPHQNAETTGEVVRDIAWGRVKSAARVVGWRALEVVKETAKTALVAAFVNQTLKYSMIKYAPKKRRRLMLAAVVVAFIVTRYRAARNSPVIQSAIERGVTGGVAWATLMYLNQLRGAKIG